jgi:hypothetical protein
MTVWIVLSLIFSLCIMLYVAAPLYEPCDVVAESAAASVDAAGRLLDSKERALRAIKDLELDFTMGKVSKEDFDRSYAELSEEVGRILQELRRHG